jgi:hypothetical protein
VLLKRPTPTEDLLYHINDDRKVVGAADIEQFYKEVALILYPAMRLLLGYVHEGYCKLDMSEYMQKIIDYAHVAKKNQELKLKIHCIIQMMRVNCLELMTKHTSIVLSNVSYIQRNVSGLTC